MDYETVGNLFTIKIVLTKQIKSIFVFCFNKFRFTYRLLDISTKTDRHTLIWTRFDAFAKQFINNTHCQEIYVTYVKFIPSGKQYFYFFIFISLVFFND